jgi:hypothetical protein
MGVCCVTHKKRGEIEPKKIFISGAGVVFSHRKKPREQAPLPFLGQKTKTKTKKEEKKKKNAIGRTTTFVTHAYARTRALFFRIPLSPSLSVCSFNTLLRRERASS